MVKYKQKDGTLIDFDVNQIIQKIMASQEVAGFSNFDDALNVAMSAQGRYLHYPEVDGNELNMFVEDLLMNINGKVARAFIENRVRKECKDGKSC